MSYTQCKDLKEVEDVLPEDKAAFITDDHRIYDKVMLSAHGMYYELNPETIAALMDLHMGIEGQIEDQCGREMSFGTVVDAAKELEEQFQAAAKAVKFRPIPKRKKA